MITLKLRQFEEIDGIRHVRTSWQISKDKNFETVEDELLNSKEFLNIWYSEIDTPVNTVFYGRGKRHFSDGSDTGWLPAVKIINIPEVANVVLLNEVVVEQPLIYIKPEEFLDNKNELITIKTSKFKANADGHFSTHWIITNSLGNVLYKNLDDTENKTSITINKKDLNIELERYNTIRIKAIHRTGTGIESSIGETELSIGNFNFEFKSTMKRIVPFSKYDIKLVKTHKKQSTGIKKFEIVNVSNGDIIYSESVNDDKLIFTIPNNILAPGSKFYIDFYAVDSTYILSRKRGILETLDNMETFRIDENFIYYNKLERLPDIKENRIPSNLVTEENINNEIYIPYNKKIAKFKFNINTNEFEHIGYLNGVNLISDKNDNIWIKRIVDNKIIIDTVDKNGQPTFMVYSLDNYNDISLLEFMVTREDEINPIGKNNSGVVIGDNLYYLTTKNKKIKKLNLKTGEIKICKELEDDVFDPILIDMNNNKLLIFTGDNSKGIIYDIKENNFYYRTGLPVNYRNRSLKTFILVNGNIIIFRNILKDSDQDSNILMYDIINHTIEEIETGLKQNNFNSVIKLKNGNILLLNKMKNILNIYKYK